MPRNITYFLFFFLIFIRTYALTNAKKFILFYFIRTKISFFIFKIIAFAYNLKYNYCEIKFIYGLYIIIKRERHIFLLIFMRRGLNNFAEF